MALEMKLSLSLPSDALSVPLARHICKFSLDQVGVQGTCLSDILLALTEACTNVLTHATSGVEYVVDLTVDEALCTIQVQDRGSGFDYSAIASRPAATAESGRGFELIRSVVDRVSVVPGPDRGTVVQLEKDLAFDEEHPVRKRLAGSGGR